MQSGELIVIGNNSISIPLSKMPSEVKAHFKDELNFVPCNPHNADYIEYEVQVSFKTKGGFVLVINWNVSGVREIAWHAYY